MKNVSRKTMPSLETDAIETAPTERDENTRIAIERAFDVIEHHTVHTKGYVAIAIQLIEESGTAKDKAELAKLLRSKTEKK